MFGCAHCARLCASARLCAFSLDCVLCIAHLVPLVRDGRAVFHDVYRSNYLHQHDSDKNDDLVQDWIIPSVNNGDTAVLY